MRKAANMLGMVALLSLSVLLVVASPLLAKPLALTKADWSQLSNIGQSYGLASALLSTLAFLAVAWSIRQQNYESRAQREQSAREMQTQILSLALNDPYLLACYPSTMEDLGSNKRFYYLNLLFWWWHHLYATGGISEAQLRFEVSQLLRGQAGREYVAKQLEFREAIGNESRSKFFSVIEEAMEFARTEGPAEPFAFNDVQIGEEARKALVSPGQKRGIVYVGVGVVLGLAIKKVIK